MMFTLVSPPLTSGGDAEPIDLYLQAGRNVLYGRDGIFEGRPGMDPGEGAG